MTYCYSCMVCYRGHNSKCASVFNKKVDEFHRKWNDNSTHIWRLALGRLWVWEVVTPYERVGGAPLVVGLLPLYRW